MSNSRTVAPHPSTHEALDALKEQLLCEYAGALPRDEITRVVSYAVRRFHRFGLRGDRLVAATALAARQALIRRIAVTIRDGSTASTKA